ncbi:MAG: hypothetical protein H7Z40_12385 [Phycisphaerae bacterium]|nr:hypothetical protein [Gemmatimonadaceae bacterium]
MRQSWTFRLLGLLLMPLFATGSWIAPALEVCPMHGSPGGSHAETGPASAALAEVHDGHLQHATVAALVVSDEQIQGTSHSPKGSDPAGSPAHGCDCEGGCCGTNGPALPGVRFAVAPTADDDRAPVAAWETGVMPVRAPHVLPFATAPPGTHA